MERCKGYGSGQSRSHPPGNHWWRGDGTNHPVLRRILRRRTTSSEVAMQLCPHCGFQNADGRNICKQCSKGLNDPVTPKTIEPIGSEQVRSILFEEIQRQVRSGWTLTGQTDATATFTRKGGTNGLIAIILLLCAILPGVLYILFGRKTETLFIQVDPRGTITRTIGVSK